MRILIIDDMEVFCDFLARDCATRLGTSKVIVCYDYKSGLTHALTNENDLIVIDVNLPDGDGVALAEEILGKKPRQRMLIVSGYCTEALAVRLKYLPIRGFFDKTKGRVTELFKAIDSILAGSSYFAPSYLEVYKSATSDPEAWSRLLTQQEQIILAQLGADIDLDEICSKLGTQKSTMYGHRKRIMHKLDLKSDAEIKHYCERTGLVLGPNGQPMRAVSMAEQRGKKDSF